MTVDVRLTLSIWLFINLFSRYKIWKEFLLSSRLILLLGDVNFSIKHFYFVLICEELAIFWHMMTISWWCISYSICKHSCSNLYWPSICSAYARLNQVKIKIFPRKKAFSQMIWNTFQWKVFTKSNGHWIWVILPIILGYRLCVVTYRLLFGGIK